MYENVYISPEAIMVKYKNFQETLTTKRLLFYSYSSPGDFRILDQKNVLILILRPDPRIKKKAFNWAIFKEVRTI